MKPIYLLLILSVSFISRSTAQNWALPSSRWIETEFSPWSGSTWPNYLYVEKDTVVLSMPCAKVQDSLGYTAPIFTYLSGDTVYMFVNGRFEASMYFGAHTGDTLQFYTDGNAIYDSIPYIRGKVDSVTLISINGQSLRQFYISIIDTLPVYFVTQYIYPHQITYAEKIGFLYTYPSLFYQMYSGMVDADSYGLCNYGDSTISGFWLYPNADCRARHVGIEDVSSDQIFSIYPNPASEYLRINTSLKEYKIRLTDLSGRVIPLIQNNDEIDIRSLSVGIYFVNIISSDQLAVTRKFVKE
jgi:hypothetical protein